MRGNSRLDCSFYPLCVCAWDKKYIKFMQCNVHMSNGTYIHIVVCSCQYFHAQFQRMIPTTFTSLSGLKWCTLLIFIISSTVSPSTLVWSLVWLMVPKMNPEATMTHFQVYKLMYYCRMSWQYSKKIISKTNESLYLYMYLGLQLLDHLYTHTSSIAVQD